MTQAPPTFEEKLQTLQTLIEELEQGDLPLSQALETFKQGQGLLKSCRADLAQIEMEVEKIISADGQTESIVAE